MAKRIVYYTSKTGDCVPCKEINELVEQGKFHSPDTDEIDVVDITTDEGFDRFNREILSKQDGAVPSAYLDGKKCMILIEDDVVHFECQDENPSNALPSNPDEKPSPSGEDASHDASQPDPPPEPPAEQS